MADEWVGKEPDISSPYYPYVKVTDSATLAGAENLPYVLTRYLMDMPSPGYTPPSDNRYPRARLKKLLYWDGELPLEQPLPTAEQMLSIKYNPLLPDAPPDIERGYRVFPQEMVRQSQHKAQSILRIYLGDATRQWVRDVFVWRQQVVYVVMVNVGMETNTGMTAISRAYDMAQAIVEATEGVNIGGIGALTGTRVSKFDDERINSGYKIYQYIDWNGSAPNPFYAE